MPHPNLHFKLTRRAPGWISPRATGAGFHWATEVYLDSGYVADATVIASLQQRFWLATTKHSNKTHTFHSSTNVEVPEHEILSHNPDPQPIPERLVIVFETKVSRGDFLATFNPSNQGNRLTPIGNLHYLITPPQLTCLDHLPPWWGLLQQSGRGLREFRPAQFFNISEDRLWHAAFRVLLASHRNPATHEQLQEAFPQTPGKQYLHRHTDQPEGAPGPAPTTQL